METDEQVLTQRLFYLRRRYMPQHRMLRGIIDAPSWVNVVLLVLMFFILQSGFVLQPGIVVDLPASPMIDGARYGSLVVTLGSEGMIFFDDERTTMDGLGTKIMLAAKENPDSALVIEADGRVAQSRLVEVYNLALKAGIRKVVLATRIAAQTKP